MTNADHWEKVYQTKPEDAVSWFQADPALSLELVQKYAEPGDPIVDVGAGASRLVDQLVSAELGPITVLDLSEAALRVSQVRLGAAAEGVTWIATDVTEWDPQIAYQVWHDRAVFHFLTDTQDQEKYLSRMDAALQPGGVAIIATFALDGPEKCSGLPVQRYSGETLEHRINAFAPDRFKRLGTQDVVHETPFETNQRFQVSVFRKLA
ncbi:class I SAM-dependent methyltransferase [Actibacterium pelagium]|uniref:Methyltransferase domain-containing protein n=1 Tax=Actibacterium pelagium TaxID=2029103 RepID=A0A917AEA5_9RHOB|nr:class I SAM-dependent methyltransferase [Actibacterium pelagium]GGE46407.1 hypothetical protein GCM10011517_12610 [Actibacterium pelagium]